MTTPASRRDFILSRAVPGFLLLLGAALSLAELRSYRIGIYEDDAAYVLGAVSMASGSFQNLASPVPVPMTGSFPGLSLLLTPFAAVCAPRWDLLRAVPWALSAATPFLLWATFKSRLTPWGGCLFLGLVALNPFRLQTSVRILTEPVLLCLAALVLAILAARREKFPPASFAALLCVTVFASMLRPEGILLGVTTSLVLFYSKKNREALAVLAAALAFSLASYLRAWLFTKSPGMYEDAFFSNLVVIGQNYGYFLGHILSFTFLLVNGTFLPGRDFSGQVFVMAVAAAASGILVLLGVRRLARGAGRLPETVLLAAFFPFSLVLVHWLWFTLDTRYIVPITPFLLLFAVSGIEEIFRLRPPVMKVLAGAVAAGLLAGCVHAGIARLSSPSAPGFLNQVPIQTLSWADKNLPQEAVILSPAPNMVRLYAGRPGYYFPSSEGWDEFRFSLALRKISHIVMFPRRYLSLPNFQRGRFHPALDHRSVESHVEAHPETFRVIHKDAEETSAIHEVPDLSEFMKSYKRYIDAYNFYDMNDDAAALKVLEEVLEGDPQLSSAVHLQAAVRLRQGAAPRDVLKKFQEAVRLDPSNAAFQANLNSLLESMGRKNAARN